MSKSRFAAVLIVFFGSIVSLQSIAQNEVEIGVHAVADGVYMLTGQGGNIGLSVGADGAFIVDDQFAPLNEKIKMAVAGLTKEPIKFVVNTHLHGDHTGGNQLMAEQGAIIVAHENVRSRLAAASSDTGGLPVVTFEDGVTFHWNDQTIEVSHVDASHTDGDSFVIFKEANVIHTGDGYISSGYPFVDIASGGSVRGFISNVNHLLGMMDDSTKIIPGHGPIASKKDVETFLKVVTLAVERVEALKKSNMTLEQVQEAKPMAEYDADWGKGFMNPDAFLAGVYNSL